MQIRNYCNYQFISLSNSCEIVPKTWTGNTRILNAIQGQHVTCLTNEQVTRGQWNGKSFQ